MDGLEKVRRRKHVSEKSERYVRKVIKNEAVIAFKKKLDSTNSTCEFDNVSSPKILTPADTSLDSYCETKLITRENDSIERLSDPESDPICTLNERYTGNVIYSKVTVPNHFSMEENTSLQTELAQWAVSSHISRSSFNDLLEILRKPRLSIEFEKLPSDCRTLLKLNNKNEILKTHSGWYYHFGISEGILYTLNDCNSLILNESVLELDINVDGLPLTKSSGSQFWPIMGSISNIPNLEPFVIGIFHSDKKPQYAQEILSNFITEYLKLKNTGIKFQNKIFQVSISKFICDAPAKAFILCIKNHNSYFGCTKCIVEGVFYNRRMCYEQINCAERSDELFKNNLYDDFQISKSPLLDIDVSLSHFPLDPMHLVYLGVMKRLLTFWVKGDMSVRMNQEDIALVDQNLFYFRKCISYKDFSRLPRSVKDIDRWKATEFRQFLLYSGPIVLKNRLKPSQYTHFMALHCGIRILSSSSLCLKYNSFARKLLNYFVQNYSKVYGREYISHNVHNLIHLADDVRSFGTLDSFSAFKFENKMSEIKKSLKSSQKPLQQFINREHEIRIYKQKKKLNIFPILSKSIGNREEPVLNNSSVVSFKYIKFQNYELSVDDKNSHCVLKNGEIVKILDIFQCLRSNEIYISFKKYKDFKNYYTSPFQSKKIYCGAIDNLLDDIEILPMNDVMTKCIKFRNYVISII